MRSLHHCRAGGRIPFAPGVRSLPTIIQAIRPAQRRGAYQLKAHQLLASGPEILFVLARAALSSQKVELPDSIGAGALEAVTEMQIARGEPGTVGCIETELQIVFLTAEPHVVHDRQRYIPNHKPAQL